jgi:hypothetical protein
MQDDAEDMELDQLAGLAPPPPAPATEAEVEVGMKARRRKGAEAEEAIPKDSEDAYEECYPDYGGFTGAVVDSDEEDVSHMDSKEGGRSRYYFEKDAQWDVPPPPPHPIGHHHHWTRVDSAALLSTRIMVMQSPVVTLLFAVKLQLTVLESDTLKSGMSSK